VSEWLCLLDREVAVRFNSWCNYFFVPTLRFLHSGRKIKHKAAKQHWDKWFYGNGQTGSDLYR